MKSFNNLQSPVALLKKGIQHLQELAGETWTDHNIHDPGLTILEQLSFALADLNYRTSFDMRDLLTLPTESRDKAHALFTARETLPSAPVTISDYRKLILDVEGIRNAWAVKAKQDNLIFKNKTGTALNHVSDKITAEATDTIQLKGLFKVLLDFDTSLNESKIKPIKEEVWSCLMNHRNMSEDFLELDTVKKEEISLSSEIEVETDASIEDTLAEIYHQIDSFLMPPLRFYSLHELIEKGMPPHEIFNGPALQHGFLLTEDLPKHRTSIHTSDLIRIVMSVKGVKAVRNFHAATHPEGVVFRSGQRWCLKLNPDLNYSPKLSPEKSHVVFVKNGVSYKANPEIVMNLYNDKKEDERKKQYPHQLKTDIEIPTGRYRNLHDYFSVQHDFPQNYGIGKEGLPATANTLRKAQAKQLKAYLLLFEQILANYQAQLANAGQFFSNHFSSKKTYFSQLPEATGIEELYQENTTEVVQEKTEDENNGKRTIRFINHKLGRFGEQVNDHPLLSSGLFGDQSPDQEITNKLVLLQEYPFISSTRTRAYNYKIPPIETNNVSGLQKRVSRLLGVDYGYKKLGDLPGEKAVGFHIVEHLLLRPKSEIDRFLRIYSPDKYHFSPWQEDPYSNIISVVVPAWPNRFKDENNGFREYFEKIVQLESPAHLTVYIHWLEHNEMRSFEQAYERWLKENAKLAVNTTNYSDALNGLIDEINLLYVNEEPVHTPIAYKSSETILIQASEKIKDGGIKNTVEYVSLKFKMGKYSHAEAGLIFDWKNEHNYLLFHYSQSNKKIMLSKVVSGVLQTILSTPVANLENAEIEMTLQVRNGKWRCRQRSPNTIGTEFLVINSNPLDGLRIGLYDYKGGGTKFHQIKVGDRVKSVITKFN